MTLEENALAHYGVKGMRWGVRKDRAPGVSSRTDRDAARDAKTAVKDAKFKATLRSVGL